MEHVVYWVVRSLVAVLQALPLRIVARIGRLGGALAYALDTRHRRVAQENLRLSLGSERTPAELDLLARETFRRLGENYASAVRTAAMNESEIREVLECVGAEKVAAATDGGRRSIVAAIGHFGNFELYARGSLWVSGFRFATTYRALPQPLLDRLAQRLRANSGCLFFERRTEAGALREAMNNRRLMVGFLADQHAGDRGLRLPFLGRECSTNAAPAVFALRYGCPLCPAICYRTALGRWRIEIGDPIPTHEDGAARAVEAIMLDVNRAFEAAIRRDPANWFWVHKRWKPEKPRRTPPVTPAPDAAGTPR